MEEIWKDIKGLEGKYQISNLGRCFNLKKGKFMKENDSSKYLRFGLPIGVIPTHRLIAIAFIDNPNNYETVNHIDENKHNNSIENLEWCTFSENTRKYFYNKKGKIGMFDFDGNLLKVFPTCRDAGRYLGKIHNAINRCVNEKRNSAYGYKWKYVE